jgi:GNAT superfamily N-acetyltransferase
MSRPVQPTAIAPLADGAILAIRPVTADDKALILDGFERLSERSRYLRFLTPTPTLSRAQLAYLSELDQIDHVGLGFLEGETPVAIGRWVRFDDDPEAADVALTVVDDFQGRGVGRLVIQALVATARHRGVRWLHFDVLAENVAMLALLDRFDAVRTTSPPVVHGVLDVASVVVPAELSDELALLIDELVPRRGASAPAGARDEQRW